MISKGTTHNNGAKLAAYLTTDKDGERAELWQLRGFGAANIKDAFRDAQIIAGATRCEQPFFHLQVRNRDGEKLTREQWEYAAGRIENMLGLTGQPRAIAFHINETTGHEHMHVAWSRIDQDSLTAKPLPFFKMRLKNISRELEMHFDLEPVTNHREGPIKYAPTRAEDEQARRLGLDIHELRNTIRDCWDRSDCGTSFQAALRDQGFILARGERRDFLAVDRAGGIHALGKRILDMTAAKIRDRLSDLPREQLPTVAQARAFIQEVHREKPKEKAKENPEPAWDRERDDRAWQDAVVNAAIEKEKTERKYVEPQKQKTESRESGAGAGSRKQKDWPIHPPVPEPIKTSPQYHFEDAAKDVVRPARQREKRVRRNRVAARIQDAHQRSDNARAFSAALDEKGIALARVTKEESERSHREAAFAKAIGNYAPRFKEDEIVAVTEPGLEYRRDGQIVEPRRIHRLDPKDAAKYVAALGTKAQLTGIDATLTLLNEKAQERAAHWREIRLKNATARKDLDYSLAGVAYSVLGPVVKTLSPIRRAARMIGKTFDFAGDAFASLFAPELTPEQKHEAATTAVRKEVEAEQAVNFSRYTEETAAQHHRQESERGAERREEQQARERGGRER